MFITTTPNEIDRLVASITCPICGGELDANIMTDGQIGEEGLIDEISSRTYCLSMDDHYNIEWDYRDPKNIIKSSETIDIVDKNIHYHIVLFHYREPKHTNTLITATDCDTSCSVKHYLPNEQLFNPKKFNKEKWLKELKTLLIFA